MLQVQLVLRELQDYKVLEEPQAQLVPQVLLAHPALLEQQVPWELLVHKVQLALQELKVHKVQQVQLVLLVLLEEQAQRVPQVQ